jgi:hypothetical protein
MQGILYEEQSGWLFVLVTIVLGGLGAWMTGRACAQTWRPYPILAFYLVILAAAVRFIHMALFEGTLLSLHYFTVDLIVVQVIGALGYRYTRVQQMVSKYGWLFQASGPFSWRARQPGS